MAKKRAAKQQVKKMYVTVLSDDEFPEMGEITLAAPTIDGLRRAWAYTARTPFNEACIQEVEVKLVSTLGTR